MRRLDEGWVDVSVPLESGMVTYPNNAPFEIWRTLDMDRGDDRNLSVLSMSLHAGTHIDAPVHFLAGRNGSDLVPLSAVIGRAQVIGIENPSAITPAELEAYGLNAGERILFRTRNSDERWHTQSFADDFVHVSSAAAQYLAQRRVSTIGVDHLSVGGFASRNGAEVHRALLSAGVWIIEGLDLSAVSPGPYELLCLPLRVVGADGAPARVLLRRLAGED